MRGKCEDFEHFIIFNCVFMLLYLVSWFLDDLHLVMFDLLLHNYLLIGSAAENYHLKIGSLAGK